MALFNHSPNILKYSDIPPTVPAAMHKIVVDFPPIYHRLSLRRSRFVPVFACLAELIVYLWAPVIFRR